MSFSSLYVGATGMTALGIDMSSIGNNLANVNTVGYKKHDVFFNDLISQNMTTSPANSEQMIPSQIGKGVGVAMARTDFREGSFQDGSSPTDLAISGKGYFRVLDDGGNTYFTRAGNFLFNNQGVLQNSHGMSLQGYAIDQTTGQVSTTLSNVALPYKEKTVDGRTYNEFSIIENPTTEIELIANLDPSSTSRIKDATDPMFSLVKSYNAPASNASTSNPFGATPSYTDSVKIFDSTGAPHEVTIAYEKVEVDSLDNTTGGYSYWQYAMYTDPKNDNSALAGTSGAGLIGYGTMTFNYYGQMADISAYTPGGANGKDLSAGQLANFGDDHHPQFSLNLPNADPVTFTLDMGMEGRNDSWSKTGTPASIGKDVTKFAEMDGKWRNVNPSTSVAGGSHTLYNHQDGYAKGIYQTTSFDSDGIMSAHYSNGQSLELYRINLNHFKNDFGLKRTAGTMFAETPESGKAIAGMANDPVHGKIASNTLESSNVDLADQFARMIITQRGFQSNSKVVTTSDAIIQNTVNMKR
ncbi:MAG: flagellar hook protein FlgE [Desulfovibrio sp.]